MKSLASQPSLDDDALRQRAAALLGHEVRSLEPVRGGGNNQTYRAECKDGTAFAFKVYGQREEVPRDRMGAEVGGLRFLERYNVSAVPCVIAHDAKAGYAAFDWVDGCAVQSPATKDIDAALRFMAELQALTSVDGTERLPLASAATLSGEAVVAQIKSRFSKFDAIDTDDQLGAQARHFLDDEFGLLRDGAVINARLRFAEAGLEFGAELARSKWALSPSDFGFHNALRRNDGRIVFVDFEYFGWDDPAKMVSDFLLHPGMTLSAAQRQRFYDGARLVFDAQDAKFHTRFAALYPLYGLCWCLIMLNEFLPENWARRSAAAGGLNAVEVRTAQLEKARRMLSTVNESLEDGPQFAASRA